MAAAFAVLPISATAVAADDAGNRMRPTDTLGQFIATLDSGGDDGEPAFRRAFSKRSDHRRLPVKVVSEHDGVRLITVADADPNFARWQRDANERLKQENAIVTPKQHPFAAAHPTKSVVVCEAGCGASTNDAIVYLEAVVPAVLPPPKGHLAANSSSLTDPAAAALLDGELPCIAGCYRDTYHEGSLHIDGEKHGSVDERGATGGPTITLERIGDASRSLSANKDASVEKHSGDGTAFTLTAPDFYDGWRTKIEFTGKERASFGPPARRRLNAPQDRIVISEPTEEARR